MTGMKNGSIAPRAGSLAPHLKLYVMVWIGYCALLVLLPVRYGRLESFTTAASMFFWVLLSAAVAYGVHGMLGRSAD